MDSRNAHRAQNILAVRVTSVVAGSKEGVLKLPFVKDQWLAVMGLVNAIMAVSQV
jgi:hypothetical protein